MKNWAMWVVYGLLAMAVMLPMLPPGFILTLDMVFVPHLSAPDHISSSYVFHALLAVLNTVVPSDVLQKIILFGILLLAGVGMHLLVRYVRPAAHGLWQQAPYVAGVLYVFNPFVYSRFMAGQYAVLLGYMLLPFFARFLLEFVKDPRLKTAIPPVVIAAAIGIVSIHTLGLLALLVLVVAVVYAWHRRKQTAYIGRLSAWIAMSAVAWVVLNSYWLVPFTLGESSQSQLTQSFDTSHHEAFASDGGMLTLLSLQGFWADAQGLYMLPQDGVPLWGIIRLILLAIIGTGIVVSFRAQRQYAVIFGITAAVAILLALGTTTPIVGSFNQWLSDIVPFFGGYREPHKFIALLALAYGYFGAWGFVAIIHKVQQRRPSATLQSLLISAVLLVPLLLASVMLWGFRGQLLPRGYPPDWQQMNQRLSEDSSNFKVLFLPWHQYTVFQFAGRIIANPASTFFDKPMIVSTNPEFAGLKPAPTDELALRVEQTILPNAKDRRDLGQRLQNHGIKYILLAKETDYRDYDYLHNQLDLQMVAETETLKLYRNNVVR